MAVAGDSKWSPWTRRNDLCEDADESQFKELGGDKRGFGTHNQYDITKWTRQERAAKCYKGKDPLADVPVKILKNDGIAFK